jgi:transposase-like protein
LFSEFKRVVSVNGVDFSPPTEAEAIGEAGLLKDLGGQRSRKVIHNWVQQANLQPDSGKSPNQIVLDETVIRINEQQFWLYAAVDPQSTEVLASRLRVGVSASRFRFRYISKSGLNRWL